MLTHEEVLRIFDYDSETGVLKWRVDVSKIAKAGTLCGGHTGTGHIRFQYKGRTYAAHRIAWVYMYGYWPKEQIDHINRIKDDNRISNLREASHSQNQHNRLKYSNNTTGLKNVGFHKKNKTYISYIRVNKERIHLGSYNCPAAASFAYQIAADMHFGEFAGVF